MKLYAASDSFLKALISASFCRHFNWFVRRRGVGTGASIRAKFEAWELRCETPSGETSEQCALTQMVKAEDAANVSLGVMVAKPKDSKNGLLHVIAPLSVFLLNGVSLKSIKRTLAARPSLDALPRAAWRTW